MTSLLFFTSADEAVVVTDTLAPDPEEKFIGHAHKAVQLPRLRLIIAGTGAPELFVRWVDFVDHQRGILDIDSVDVHAATFLQAIWAEAQSEITALINKTATIYHFGFSSQGSGDINVYAYRSENGFSSERLAYGLVLKPSISQENLKGINYSAQSLAIMRQQAKIEAANSKGVRVIIGGNVNVIHLTRYGVSSYTVENLELGGCGPITGISH